MPTTPRASASEYGVLDSRAVIHDLEPRQSVPAKALA